MSQTVAQFLSAALDAGHLSDVQFVCVHALVFKDLQSLPDAFHRFGFLIRAERYGDSSDREEWTQSHKFIFRLAGDVNDLCPGVLFLQRLFLRSFVFNQNHYTPFLIICQLPTSLSQCGPPSINVESAQM